MFFFQSSSETGLLVALLAQDGVEPERLEDLVAPSHVNTRVDRTVRTRVEFLYGIYSRIGLNMT